MLHLKIPYELSLNVKYLNKKKNPILFNKKKKNTYSIGVWSDKPFSVNYNKVMLDHRSVRTQRLGLLFYFSSY